MDVVIILGILQTACAILYAIPRTAVLGAILLTATWRPLAEPDAAGCAWATAGSCSLSSA